METDACPAAGMAGPPIQGKGVLPRQAGDEEFPVQWLGIPGCRCLWGAGDKRGWREDTPAGQK